MKYLILTYGSQRDFDDLAGRSATPWSQEDVAALHQFMTEFTKDLEETGELVETRGLPAPVHTRRVQLVDGAPVVTDGPYAETQEVMAGFWVVDCASYDRATELAAKLTRCPGTRLGEYIDVRPIVDSIDDLG
ncbi:hypothetical protein BLA60_09580 [Actinophytocola xinjiangensis]|uniref:YCII-related domain-containing protein n=1 Tax=Actinophytocola xinjiangensis TaxID=485602 RepID=A0A7Z0WSP7_9PSEU|nr:YciI family protein [Actinophytocola xinjiangensis]OLF12231.1 hypothetical protein BLA60_09580 [Actinophytocola xinjiangensis]